MILKGAYDTENTWPRVGVAGITQYDHIKGKLMLSWSDGIYHRLTHFFKFTDKSLYFDSVVKARSLQDRWKDEAGIDVIRRVITKLQSMTDMKVQIASESEKEYFAGILRAVDRGIGVHADYAPYVSSKRSFPSS